MPVEVEYGSEFRYYDPIIDKHSAVLSITQSGETADTLASSDLARIPWRDIVVDRQCLWQPIYAHVRWLHRHAGRP